MKCEACNADLVGGDALYRNNKVKDYYDVTMAGKITYSYSQEWYDKDPPSNALHCPFICSNCDTPIEVESKGVQLINPTQEELGSEKGD